MSRRTKQTELSGGLIVKGFLVAGGWLAALYEALNFIADRLLS